MSLTPWTELENRLMEGLLPFADTYDELVGYETKYNAICAILGLPFCDVINRLDYPSFKKWLQGELIKKHGDGPRSRLYEVGPYYINTGRAHFMEVGKAVLHETSARNLDWTDAIISRGKVYIQLDGCHILSIRDDEKELGEDGPIVLMRAPEHVALVKMVYDNPFRCWVPLMRPNQQLFVSLEYELFLYTLHANSKAERLPFMEGPPDSYLTVSNFMKSNPTFSMLPKGTKLKKIYTSPQLQKQRLTDGPLYVFMDLETVYSVQATGQPRGPTAPGTLLPYSIVWLAMTQEEFSSYGKNPIPTEVLLERCTLKTGYNCVNDFLDWLAHTALVSRHSEIRFSAFNGSGFDYFFVTRAVDSRHEWLRSSFNWAAPGEEDGGPMDEVFEGELTPDIYFTNQFYANGRLLSAELRVRAEGELHPTPIVFSDLSKHLLGMSLAKAGSDFHTRHRKKEGFSHDEVQRRYMSNPQSFFDEPDFKQELEEYNKYDVIVLAELTHEYILKLSEMTHVVSVDRPLPLTIGSVVYSHITDHWEREPPPVDETGWTLTPEDRERLTVCGLWEALSVQHFQTLKKAIPGGCVNLPRGPCVVKEPISSGDVKGLYSYVCTAMPICFPIGCYRELEIGEGPTSLDNILGVYHIDVDMTPMDEADLVFPLPQKQFSASGALLRNDWNQVVVNDTWVTTPILKILLRYGCKITWRGGLEWSGSVKNIDLFRSLLPFLEEKKRQDLIKGTPEANPALRTICKLFCNAAYGQTIRGLFERNVEKLRAGSFERYCRSKNIESIGVITAVGGDLYAEVRRTTESRIKTQHPFPVGIFILGWSQYYLFTTYALRVPRSSILYIDTDAVKLLRYAKEQLWTEHSEEIVPHWEEILETVPSYATCRLYGGKDGGAYEEELPEDNGGVIIASKKTYVVLNSDCSGPALEGDKIIMSAKGLRRGDVPLDAQDLGALLEVKHDPDVWLATAREIYFARPTLGEVAHLFMRDVMECGEGYVLTNSLTRSVSNSKRGVWPGDVDRYNTSMNLIFQEFRVKKISLAGVGAAADIPYVVGQPLTREAEEDQFYSQDLFVNAYGAELNGEELFYHGQEKEDVPGAEPFL